MCSYPCTLQSLTLHVEIFLMFFLFDGCVPFQFCMRLQKFCGCIMFWRCHRPSVDWMLSMRYLMLYLTDPSEFWTHMDLWYCNPTLSQTRGSKGQNWMLLLFAHGKLIFYLILKWVFLNKFLRNIPFRKRCIVFYVTTSTFDIKGGNFQIFCFFSSSNFNTVFCKMINLMGYWWVVNKFAIVLKLG